MEPHICDWLLSLNMVSQIQPQGQSHFIQFCYDATFHCGNTSQSVFPAHGQQVLSGFLL